MALIPYLDMSYGTGMSQEYKGRRVDFGEGVSQRAKRLNGAPQQWRLVWDNIPDATAEELRKFFEDRQGVELIRWTPYGQTTALKWTATGWQSKPSGWLVQSASVTLTQEFDLPGPAPVNTALPTITGNPYLGHTLTAVIGSWTNYPTSFAYQWKRNGVAITGATSKTYVLVAADLGASITVTVTASNVDADTAATSGAKGPITEEPKFYSYKLALAFAMDDYWANQVDYPSVAAMPGYSFNSPGVRGALGSSAFKYGPELVTNGTFDSNTTGWTAGSSTLSVVGGRLRITNTANNGYADASFPTVIGVAYRFKATKFIGNAASVTIYLGSTAGGSQYKISAGAGAMEHVFIATAATTYIRVYGDLSGTYVEVDDVSAQRIIDGPVTWHGASEPAINGKGYHAYGALRNAVLHSQALATGWTNLIGAAWTSDTTIAPDGTQTADTLTANAVNSTHRCQQAYTLAATGAFTFAVFARAGTGRYLQIVDDHISGTHYINFDLVAGVVGTGVECTGYIIDCGNGWYLCVVTGTAATTSGTAYLVISNSASAIRVPSFVGASETIHLWQTQSLLGRLPNGGPLIATAAAAVSIGESLLSTNINADGSALADGDMLLWAKTTLRETPTSTPVLAVFSDGSTANRVQLYVQLNNWFPTFYIAAGGVVQLSRSGAPIAFGEEIVIFARRLNGNWGGGIYRNGALSWFGADAAGLFPSLNRVTPANAVNGASSLRGDAKDTIIRVGTFDTDAKVINAILEAA